jgi:hypothetical protein
MDETNTMELRVTDARGALVATVDVAPDCPFARAPGEPPGFVLGTFRCGPAFGALDAILERIRRAFASGDPIAAATLQDGVDELGLTATDDSGQKFRVFNVCFQENGLLFAAVG